MTDSPDHCPGCRRTSWPTATNLQAAAHTLRRTPGALGTLAPLLAWHLDAIADALAWLAPFRPNEGGYELWGTASALADEINADTGVQVRPTRRITDALTEETR